MSAASRRPLWFSRRKRRCSDGLATGAKVDVDSSLEVLTEREREIVALVAQGMSNDDIGARLFVSPLTAKTHVNRAMSKLGARDRAQLVVLAYQSGLVRAGDAGGPDAG
jgi:DNA-binding NarL/FixJ family response regulator